MRAALGQKDWRDGARAAPGSAKQKAIGEPSEWPQRAIRRFWALRADWESGGWTEGSGCRGWSSGAWHAVNDRADRLAACPPLCLLFCEDDAWTGQSAGVGRTKRDWSVSEGEAEAA